MNSLELFEKCRETHTAGAMRNLKIVDNNE